MTLSKAEQLARAEKQFAEAQAKVKKLRKQHQITIMKTKLRQQTQDIARISAENKAKDAEIAKLKEQLANIGKSTEAVSIDDFLNAHRADIIACLARRKDYGKWNNDVCQARSVLRNNKK